MCLPDDGEEKKPSYSSPLDTPIRPAAALSTQGRRFSLPGADRRPTEGAAMLIRPAFQRNKFLKKACAQQGTAPAKNMYYTMQENCIVPLLSPGGSTTCRANFVDSCGLSVRAGAAAAT